MTKGRPAHRPSRRAHVLQAALTEIGRDGQSGELPTVGSIAQAAGATPAAIHYHFPSRTDLYVALIEEIHPGVIRVFDDALADDGEGAWATRFFNYLADWVETNPLEARYYFLVAPAIAHEKVIAAAAAAREEFLDRIAEDLPPDTETDLRRWVRGLALREIVLAALELAFKNRSAPPRGLHALRRAGLSVATRLDSEKTSTSPSCT